MTFEFKDQDDGALFDLFVSDPVPMNGVDGTLLDVKKNALIVRDPTNLADFVNGMVLI
jgi:hypothetical protein